MIQTLEYAACHIVPRDHDDTFRHWQNDPVSNFQATHPANTGMAYDVPPSAARSFHATTRFFSEWTSLLASGGIAFMKVTVTEHPF
jgi:hypothetical protein